MDELFDGIQAFVYTAEAASFRRAAERLGVSPAAVSRALGRLEEDLGVTLLHRTTRRVALSAEGELYLARCREALAAMEDGRRALAEVRAEPRGRVVISMSPVLGRPVTALSAALMAAHPALELELRVSDRLASLVDDAVDIALRLGELEDSELMARRLGRLRWSLVAAPSLLSRVKRPRHPRDLEGLPALRFRTPNGGLVEPRFTEEAPRLSGGFTTDNGELLVEAARAGLGLAQVFWHMVEADLRGGNLVELLADHAPPGPALHALWRPGQQRLPRVRATLDFLAERLTLGG